MAHKSLHIDLTDHSLFWAISSWSQGMPLVWAFFFGAGTLWVPRWKGCLWCLVGYLLLNHFGSWWWCWWPLGYLAPGEPSIGVSSNLAGWNLSAFMNRRTSPWILCSKHPSFDSFCMQELINIGNMHPSMQTFCLYSHAFLHTLLYLPVVLT